MPACSSPELLPLLRGLLTSSTPATDELAMPDALAMEDGKSSRHADVGACGDGTGELLKETPAVGNPEIGVLVFATPSEAEVAQSLVSGAPEEDPSEPLVHCRNQQKQQASHRRHCQQDHSSQRLCQPEARPFWNRQNQSKLQMFGRCGYRKSLVARSL